MVKHVVGLLIAGSAILSGCASREHVSSLYNDHISDRIASTSKRTVIFFLVDGLPLKLTTDEVNNGRLPAITRYFVGSSHRFFVGHTGFPSLTFPSIGSLITERPVDQNGLYGNTLVENGKTIDFQSPENYTFLNEMISGKNIFSRLRAKGLKTVSLDYSFTSNANVHTSDSDIAAGLAALDKDYDYIDKKLIDSLHLLLTQTEPDKWPDFIFVHLVGVDFTSHDHGPDSPAVKKYLEALDSQLEPVFKTLNSVEASHQREVVAFLSADHGFDVKVSKTMKIEEAIHKFDGHIKVLNESRYAALYFPSTWSSSQKAAMMKSYAAHSYIDITAYRENETVFIFSGSSQTTIAYGPGDCRGSTFSIAVLPAKTFVCPDQLDNISNNLYYPFFVSNLSRYFQSPSHPDAVIIPKPGVAFTTLYKGQHGGPTPREVFIPLLIHNGELKDLSGYPALWDVLNFL